MSNKIQKTIEFATMAHAGQVRKESGLPYICHPIGVLNQIVEWGCHDHDIWMAAICHDVFEDTDYNIDDVEKVIGHKAAMIVDELTFFSQNDPVKEKEQYIAKWGLKNDDGTWQRSVESLIVKFADRIVNTRDFISADSKYAKKYWHKADSLIAAKMDRREEISNVYGKNMWLKMTYSQAEIISRLV